jgi:hypothetical protein
MSLSIFYLVIYVCSLCSPRIILTARSPVDCSLPRWILCHPSRLRAMLYAPLFHVFRPSQVFDGARNGTLAFLVERHFDMRQYTAAIHSSRVHPKHGKYKEPFKFVPVTTNLALLLRHLRQSIIPRLLWVDAICFHVDRYRVEYRRNLRFGPLFPRGVHCALSRLPLVPAFRYL